MGEEVEFVGLVAEDPIERVVGRRVSSGERQGSGAIGDKRGRGVVREG